MYIYIYTYITAYKLPPNHAKWPCEPMRPSRSIKCHLPVWSLGWTCWNETCPSTGSTPRTESFAPTVPQKTRCPLDSNWMKLMWSSRSHKSLLHFQGLHLKPTTQKCHMKTFLKQSCPRKKCERIKSCPQIIHHLLIAFLTEWLAGRCALPRIRSASDVMHLMLSSLQSCNSPRIYCSLSLGIPNINAREDTSCFHSWFFLGQHKDKQSNRIYNHDDYKYVVTSDTSFVDQCLSLKWRRRGNVTGLPPLGLRIGILARPRPPVGEAICQDVPTVWTLYISYHSYIYIYIIYIYIYLLYIYI